MISMPLMARAGLMATVSATVPAYPAASARSCAVEPSDPKSPSNVWLCTTSFACHWAARRRFGLIFRSLVQPAFRRIVYTFATTLSLSLLLSAAAGGAVSVPTSTVLIAMTSSSLNRELTTVARLRFDVDRLVRKHHRHRVVAGGRHRPGLGGP